MIFKNVGLSTGLSICPQPGVNMKWFRLYACLYKYDKVSYSSFVNNIIQNRQAAELHVQSQFDVFFHTLLLCYFNLFLPPYLNILNNYVDNSDYS